MHRMSMKAEHLHSREVGEVPASGVTFSVREVLPAPLPAAISTAAVLYFGFHLSGVH